MRDNPGSSIWPGWKSDIKNLEDILEQVVATPAAPHPAPTEFAEAKQICTRLAIYIEQEEAKLRSMRHQIRQQVLYRGFETPEDSRMVNKANDLEDFLGRLKGVLG